MTGVIQPLAQNFQIVDERGFPTLYFVQWTQQRQIDISKGITLADLQQFLAEHPLIAGSGIGLSPSGNIAQGVTISAEVQAILNQLSTVRGTVIFRGASDWQALAPGAAGNFLRTNGAGADPSWAAGGGSGGYFKGATGYYTTASTSAFANKGLCFRPSRNVTLTDLHAWIDPTNLGAELYQLGIASLSSMTLGANRIVTACTIGAVLGTTTPRLAFSVNGHVFSDALPSPVNLVAGTDYLVFCARTDGTGTTALRIATAPAIDGGPAWTMNFPGETFVGTPQFNTIALTPSQTASAVGTGTYTLFIEGGY